MLLLTSFRSRVHDLRSQARPFRAAARPSALLALLVSVGLIVVLPDVSRSAEARAEIRASGEEVGEEAAAKVAGAASSETPTTAANPEPTPPGPSLEALQAVRGILSAQRFTLKEPYVFEWSREGLEVNRGHILVLAVDPLFCRPLTTGMPVLYVGPRPAEIVNGANTSGHLIAIAPGDLDLEETPIFYGSILLPERVDAARGRAERDAAVALGIVPLPPHEIARAIAAGGRILELGDVNDLRRSLAKVVVRWSPEEEDLIRTLRLVP